MLVHQARDLQYRSFSKTLAYWAQLADPDGAEGQARRNHQARTLHLSQGWGASGILDGVFDAIGGEILAQALKTIEDELFHADWAEAKARVGERVSHAVLRRTPAQRRADALVEMARRSAAAPEGSRLPEPLFSVVVDYESFQRTCELGAGQRGHPRQLDPLAGPGLGAAGGLRRSQPGQERGRSPEAVHRRHPDVGAGAGAGVLPSLLRHSRL